MQSEPADNIVHDEVQLVQKVRPTRSGMDLSTTGRHGEAVTAEGGHGQPTAAVDAHPQHKNMEDRQPERRSIGRKRGALSSIKFTGLQLKPSETAKMARQQFSLKGSFRTTAKRPPIANSAIKRTESFLKESAIPQYSEKEFKRMRSSPSRIIQALKRGGLSPKVRNFSFAAWSEEDSATARFMRHLLALEPKEIAQLRTEMRQSSLLTGLESEQADVFKERFYERLDKQVVADEDLDEWTRIVLAPSNARAARYISSSCAAPPMAIFNEVMRDITMDVRTLRKLATSCKLSLVYFAERKSIRESGNMQDNQFITIFSLLMKHARSICPSMLSKSIAPLITEYCLIISLQPMSKSKLSERLHSICNAAVVRFAMTPEKHPMENMEYAWKAQSKILQLGDSFTPSLELEPNTYRAIIKVLLACKKTEWEVHAISHLHRTWPPWRKTQDGMDARIQPDEELTRVVSVIRNLISAGYSISSFDRMAMILGGRDVDGTPSIPTRTILKSRYGKTAYNPASTNDDLEWAARVRATRDVREAWAAFRACNQAGKKPTQAMFDEMLEKLLLDTKREAGARNTPRIPGAAKEVAIYYNDNLSETELQRVNPPSLHDLLALMKTIDVKLSQKSLALLIEAARSPKEARDFMVEHGQDEMAVHQISQGRRAQNFDRSEGIVLKAIPDALLTAYIKLLSRFSAYKHLRPDRHGGLRNGADYLLDVIHILKLKPELRVGWFVLLKTIALVKVSKDGKGYDFAESNNLWNVLADALYHLWRNKKVIDPDHFGYGCYGLYNAVAAERHGYRMEPVAYLEGVKLIKDLWIYLTKVPDTERENTFLPTMLHEVKGWQLHAYVRLLALTKQKDQMVNVLGWMTEHERDLDTIAVNRQNGLVGLRRTLIAMRVFAMSTNDALYEQELCEVAEEIPQDWGGWPTDTEVEEYLSYTSEAEEIREIDPNMKLGHGIIQNGGEGLFSRAEDGMPDVGLDGLVTYRPM